MKKEQEEKYDVLLSLIKRKRYMRRELLLGVKNEEFALLTKGS